MLLDQVSYIKVAFNIIINGKVIRIRWQSNTYSLAKQYVFIGKVIRNTKKA